MATNMNPIYYAGYPSFALALTTAAAADYDGAAATLLNAGSANGPMDLLWLGVTPVDTTQLGNIVRAFKKIGSVKIPIGDWDIRLMTKVATGIWRGMILLPFPVTHKFNVTTDELYVSQEKNDKLTFLAQYGSFFTGAP